MAKYIHRFNSEQNGSDYISNRYEEPFVACLDGYNYVFYNIYGLNGHDYVNLGLPSGNVWATCNVGASNPEGYGDYFAWGEVSTKSSYTWENYIYGSGTYSKYNDTDGLKRLQKTDDPAAVNMSGHWRIPSTLDIQELIDETTQSWETLNGVNGKRFTGSNGNSIFIPAGGYKSNSSTNYSGTSGFLWTAKIGIDNQIANGTFFNIGNSTYSGSLNTMSRFVGCPVRGVIGNGPTESPIK